MLFRNIVAAYDGSNLSKKALQKAVQLAQLSNAKLNVIHVFQLPVYPVGDAAFAFTEQEAGLLNDEQEVLSEAKSMVPPEITATYTMEKGSPAKEILDFADKVDADLIVIGSRGLGPIREFILGSVSHNVVQHAKIPVLVIK